MRIAQGAHAAQQTPPALPDSNGQSEAPAAEAAPEAEADDCNGDAEGAEEEAGEDYKCVDTVD